MPTQTEENEDEMVELSKKLANVMDQVRFAHIKSIARYSELEQKYKELQEKYRQLQDAYEKKKREYAALVAPTLAVGARTGPAMKDGEPVIFSWENGIATGYGLTLRVWSPTYCDIPSAPFWLGSVTRGDGAEVVALSQLVNLHEAKNWCYVTACRLLGVE